MSLLHLGLGLLAMLPFVPRRAGTKFFKFCSAAAAFLMAAGGWMLYRRFGLHGAPAAPGGERYEPMLIAAYGVAVAPWVEECIFRGLLQPATARKLGRTAGVWITTLVFAAFHLHLPTRPPRREP